MHHHAAILAGCIDSHPLLCKYIYENMNFKVPMIALRHHASFESWAVIGPFWGKSNNGGHKQSNTYLKAKNQLMQSIPRYFWPKLGLLSTCVEYLYWIFVWVLVLHICVEYLYTVSILIVLMCALFLYL